MAVLCQLADPEHYQAFDWDLSDRPDDRTYWMNLFATFPEKIRHHLMEDGLAGDDFDARWAIFRAEYDAGMTDRIRYPDRFDLSTIALGEFRQAMLNRHGWPDPYARVKQRENDLAARLYSGVVARIDVAPPEDRWDLLIRGVFAGNTFDLGSPETIEMYHRGEIDFGAVYERIPPRRWPVDDFDDLLPLLAQGAWEQALFFVDNAGTDIVLGVMPVVREMARRGTRVVMAANSTPALNDITIGELDPLLDQLCQLDRVLNELVKRDRIRTVASGSGSPLIDLSRVSDACNAAAADSDLVVLEGMGRGVESNWRQRFRCDIWRVALLKDRTVASWVEAPLFHPVCRFDQAGSSRFT
jgi:type II pantothenate kinase